MIGTTTALLLGAIGGGAASLLKRKKNGAAAAPADEAPLTPTVAPPTTTTPPITETRPPTDRPGTAETIAKRMGATQRKRSAAGSARAPRTQLGTPGAYVGTAQYTPKTLLGL